MENTLYTSKQTQNKRKFATLYFGAVVTIVSLIMMIYGYSSKEAGPVTADDTMILVTLVCFVIGIVFLVSGAITSFRKETVISQSAQKEKIVFLALAAMFAALSYIGFQFFQIPFSVGTEKTAIHFGNGFVVIAALFLGGKWGGLSGAVGLTIADLTAGYATSAPKTFFLKLCIGLIAGFIAHNIFHISRDQPKKKVVRAALIASICCMSFNIVADPVVGYFYKTYLLGIPQDLSKALAKIAAGTTAVNAVSSVIIAVVLYSALRPALKKAGLFVQPENKKHSTPCK